MLRTGGELLAQVAVALRLGYAAVFAVAGGHLLGAPDPARFQAIWDAGLLLFGMHLVLTGITLARSLAAPTWIGVLLVVAGLGYMVDGVLVAAAAGVDFSAAEVVFLGEVALLIWLLGWSGRTALRRSRVADGAAVG